MKLKIFNCFFCFIIFFNKSVGQQIFKISQIQQHNFLYNPAAVGASNKSSIGATYRKMWAGIAGGPQTSLIFGDMYIENKKLGIGGALYADKTGPTSRTGSQLNFSYSIPLKNESKLMFGVGANVLQYKIDKTGFANYIPNDPLLSSDGTEIKGDAALGVYYNSPTLNIGISVQQLAQSKLNFIKTNTNPEGKLYRHFFLMASNNIRVDEANVFVPNVLIKYLPNAPADIEAGIKLEHNDFMWVGLNWHYKQSYSALLGIKINKQFSLGYAYDEYKTPLSIFDDGGVAHEITFKYIFNK